MRKFVQATTVIALVFGLVGTFASTADATTLRKVALGVAEYNNNNINDQAHGGYLDPAMADAYNTTYGRYPAVWMAWSDWGSSSTGPFANSVPAWIKNDGMTPLVTWEPLDPTNPSCSNWSNQTILDHDHDQYIKDWADAAKAYGHTVLVRFAHEMNGYWFVWGASNCGADNSPAKYKQAWQYVVNIFRARGATNVKWVWNPSGSASITPYYPGNTYVDYLGVTAFNWGGYDGFGWRSLVAAFKGTMSKFANAGYKKPVIGVEVGSAPDKTNCSTCIKSQWITNGYPALYTKYPKIKAIVYFDVNMLTITHNVQPDWRLQTPIAAQNAYKNIVAMPKFQGIIP